MSVTDALFPRLYGIPRSSCWQLIVEELQKPSLLYLGAHLLRRQGISSVP